MATRNTTLGLRVEKGNIPNRYKEWFLEHRRTEFRSMSQAGLQGKPWEISCADDLIKECEVSNLWNRIALWWFTWPNADEGPYTKKGQDSSHRELSKIKVSFLVPSNICLPSKIVNLVGSRLPSLYHRKNVSMREDGKPVPGTEDQNELEEPTEHLPGVWSRQSTTSGTWKKKKNSVQLWLSLKARRSTFDVPTFRGPGHLWM